MKDNILELQQLVERYRDARDWAQFHSPKDVSAALAIEAAELQECFLWKSPAQVEEALEQPAEREAIEDEMADVLAYLLSLASVTGTDLSAALVRKMAKNEEKYPAELAKGSARKYHAYTK